MGRYKRRHVDIYVAPKKFSFLKKFLELIGKPFFLLLFYTFIGSAVALISMYRYIGTITKQLGSLRTLRTLRILIKTPIVKPTRTGIQKIKLPRIKIGWRATAGLVVLTSLLLTFYFLVFRDLPSPQDLTARPIDISTKIYDRNGILLYKIYKSQNRTPVPLETIPHSLRYATLAAEDAEFYSHPGFSIRGIIRSIVRNATRGELTGGSTITQQLVKNALLSPEKTLVRKIREIILSIQTELSYSKDQILEMYLNEVSYGGTAYGIQEAARLYFGKDVEDLTLAESAFLAGLPKSPSKYSPFGENPEAATQRQKDVLRLMKINGFISEEAYEMAQNETLTFAQNKNNILAPHFVMYVKNQLAAKYGEEVLERGGLEITTSLDYQIQKLAEETVKSEVDKLRRLNVGNAAALVLNPTSGEILAMVGSKDYFANDQDGQVNVTTQLRQPGSAIKVVNYAHALANGYTPASILADTPVSFSVPSQPVYIPKNYDGKYRGNLSLRSALAESRNIPAVKVLASYGVDKMIEQGRAMGITSWEDKNQFGLSLTLGGGEVKLIELARVYATLANYGRRPELISVLKISNYQGKVLEEAKPVSKEVLDPRVAFQLIDILKDNTARSPSFGQNSALVISGHPEVAVKTGTSNNLRDNLTLGFNQKYLVAVWVGNNDNSPMARIASGITGAAPIWNKIMSVLLASEKTTAWAVPEGLVSLAICSYTGTLPCNGCPTRQEWFIKGTEPKYACKEEAISRIVEEIKRNGGQILPEAASTIN